MPRPAEYSDEIPHDEVPAPELSVATTDSGPRIDRAVLKTALAEIKARINIPFLLVELAKQADPGNVQVVFCPFHANVNTPSFHIRHEGRGYFCYGCGKKGDAITFVQDLYLKKTGARLVFTRAVQLLAHLAGVAIDTSPETLSKVAEMIRTSGPRLTGDLMTPVVRQNLARWAKRVMLKPLQDLRRSGAPQCYERSLYMWDHIDDLCEEITGHEKPKERGQFWVTPRKCRPAAFQSEILDLKEIANGFLAERP